MVIINNNFMKSCKPINWQGKYIATVSKSTAHSFKIMWYVQIRIKGDHCDNMVIIVLVQEWLLAAAHKYAWQHYYYACIL